MTDFGIGDAGLWLIIERGLRKKPQERWDTMRVLGEALALWLYERGIREDAYGASLKTTWLQSGIDGVKIDTPSMSPPADELEPAIPDAERTTLPAPDEVSSDAAPAAVIVPAPSGAAAQQVLVVRRPLWQYFAGAMTVTVLLSATISLIVGRLVTSRDERADGVSEALPQPSVASQTLPTSAPVPSEAVPPPSATALEVSPQAEDGANIPSTPATDAGASKAKTRRRTAPAHPTQRGKLPPPGTFDFGF
jgi:serine/threonine-protein kinase